MADTPSNTESLARFGEQHTARLKISSWTTALEIIGARRADESPRYEAFRAFVSRFLLPSSNGPAGFDLRGLSEAQKWLLLVTIDEFLDQEIIFHDTEEGWSDVWEQATQLYEAGFGLIHNHPEVLSGKLDEAWSKFRAAAS